MQQTHLMMRCSSKGCQPAYQDEFFCHTVDVASLRPEREQNLFSRLKFTTQKIA